jgi:hypothetical protein
MSKHTRGPYQRTGRHVYRLIDNPDPPRRGRPTKINLWLASVQPCGTAVETAELEAVARLFEAAPDLYEALKAGEWSGPQMIDGTDTCPCCRAEYRQGHTPSCLIGNALRKAQGGGE